MALVPKTKPGSSRRVVRFLISCIINLHKTDIKQAARAGLFAALKNHAFRMSPLRLNRKMLMFGTLGLPYLKKKSAAANMT